MLIRKLLTKAKAQRALEMKIFNKTVGKMDQTQFNEGFNQMVRNMDWDLLIESFECLRRARDDAAKASPGDAANADLPVTGAGTPTVTENGLDLAPNNDLEISADLDDDIEPPAKRVKHFDNDDGDDDNDDNYDDHVIPEDASLYEPDEPAALSEASQELSVY